MFFYRYTAVLCTCHFLSLVLYASNFGANGQTGVCTRTRADTVYSLKYSSRLYYYSQSYSTCCSHFIVCWNYCRRSRTRSAYQSYSYSSSGLRYRTQSYCCSGYSGSPSSSCEPICSGGCGHGQCTAPSTCSCNNGWKGGSCNIDINECSTNNGGCSQKCSNTDGSYYCSCSEGYRLKSDAFSCEDINECDEGLVKVGETKTSLWCHQKCVNTLGSYQCACNTGYQLGTDSRTCLDIDQCAVDNGGCDHTCHNTSGSYYCTCNQGYLLLEDKKGCTDHDECLNNVHGCDHQCHNTHGGYYCSCNSGYRLNGTTSCIDIDECAEGLVSVGKPIQTYNSSRDGAPETNKFWCEHICINTVGSFECDCETGYYLENDNQTCLDIDECAEGLVSVGKTIQTYNSSRDGAPETNMFWCEHICINTVGSFECDCETGYYLEDDNQTCSDLDECQYGNGGCAHICVNQLGSYQCQCKDKYLLANNSHDCYALCEPNTFSWNGLEPCTPCPSHHYQLEFGSIKCLECNISVSFEACLSVLSTMPAASDSSSPSLLHKSISATSSTVLPVMISIVLIIVLIVAVVLIVTFSLLAKKGKRVQCCVVQQGHNSLELSPNGKTNRIYVEGNYDFKNECQFEEEPVMDGQPIYDNVETVDSEPVPPSQNAMHIEKSKMKFEQQYEVLDTPYSASESGNYTYIKPNKIPISPYQISKQTETSLVKLYKDNVTINPTNPGNEPRTYEEAW